MGPRGHGPIKQKCSLCQPSRFPNDILEFWTCKNLFVSPVGFQTTFWDFGHLKNLFASPVGFQTTFQNFGHFKTYFGKIIKNHENHCFFQHGKPAHRSFEKGALNDSSRSLICSFLEQIVFLQIGEKVSKVSKLDQFWAHPRWS